jgi:AcrR family transcriptional regulator
MARPKRGRPPKTAAQRADGNRRQDLIKAAARLFRQVGFAATSTRDIAAAVGMRSGSPFYHFDSKQALLVAVMEDGMQSALQGLESRIDQARNQSSDDVQLLHTMVRAHMDVLWGNQHDFIPVMLQEWQVLSADQRRGIAALKDAYEAHWNPVLQRLIDQGRLRGDVAMVRLMLFGAMNWTLKWYDPQGKVTLDAWTEQLMALVLQPAQAD